MKRISILFLAFALFTTACDDYLNINENPNAATEVSPQLVLPQALAATALTLNRYNTYGSQLGGYAANAGGYGGFNETITYLYTANNYADGLWSPTYDNLEDFQYIINKSAEDEKLLFYGAVSKIMKAYNFQKLVDAFDDIPYSQALTGLENLLPAYDQGEAVYAAIATLLDEAIADINNGYEIRLVSGAGAVADLGTADIVFGGADNEMDLWKQLANTIKLRLMVTANGKVTFSNTSFDAVGFLSDVDALIDPGYTRDLNRQNPKWDSWAWGYTGTAGNKAWIPTNFAMRFYDGTKLDDPYRGSAVYYQFPGTGTNDLGREAEDTPKSPNGGSFWYSGANRTGTSAGSSPGPLKGPDASMPLFTLTESYFLQAEAAVRGIIAGDPKSLFEAGIENSFEYLYMLPGAGIDNIPSASYDGDYAGDAAAYIADNSGSRLVNFDLATSNDEKIEAIITQKWIALNFVNSEESWNDYRRTGFPTVTSGDTFASVVSASTRPDKLPTRILYPFSESQYNAANVPSGISSISSTIFWAQ
jgi:hypothetical protein